MNFSKTHDTAISGHKPADLLIALMIFPPVLSSVEIDSNLETVSWAIPHCWDKGLILKFLWALCHSVEKCIQCNWGHTVRTDTKV